MTMMKTGWGLALLGGALSALVPPAHAKDGPAVSVHVTDRATGRVLERHRASADIAVPDGLSIRLVVVPDQGARVDRVYFESDARNGADCRLRSGLAARLDDRSPFRATVADRPDCRWRLTAYDDRARTQKTVTLRLVRGETPRRYDLTQGTGGASHLEMSGLQRRSEHGTRVQCVVSHLSYDDPIVHPGRPGAAHLHMFLGNTTTNAHSTAASLKRANRSSCEGGTSMESAYWMPALFDAQDRVVLPERFTTYYKTFVPGRTPDRLPRGTVKPIPDGLEMLASPDTQNFDQYADLYRIVGPHDGLLKISVAFPQCVAVAANGEPVLSHRDMPGEAGRRVNSHMSYVVWASGNLSGCPQSHPYRIPGVFFNAWYDVDPASRWYLSSDTDRSRPGHSLHADYMSAWDQGDMAKAVRCNEEGRSCKFTGNASQHPDRFYAEDGTRVYINSVLLEWNQSRTPWGRTLSPLLGGGHHGHGGHGSGH